MRTNLRAVALLYLLGLGTTGCDDSPATGTVSGTITVDGAVPADGASINFMPIDGKGVTSGATLDKGKYSVKVPVGNMKVEIRAPKPAKGGKVAAKAEPGPGGDGPGGGGWIEESLPPEYHEKSTLTYDVKSGSQEKNWECSTAKK